MVLRVAGRIPCFCASRRTFARKLEKVLSAAMDADARAKRAMAKKMGNKGQPLIGDEV